MWMGDHSDLCGDRRGGVEGSMYLRINATWYMGLDWE
jgi:hypothetical protein